MMPSLQIQSPSFTACAIEGEAVMKREQAAMKSTVRADMV
jgi:hypothetical protein